MSNMLPPTQPTPTPGNQIQIRRPTHPSPGAYQTRIGDAAVHEHAVITPMGTWPIRGSVWTLAQQPTPQRKTTTVGVVLAVLSSVLAVAGAPFTCGGSLFLLFGLFFLALKADTLAGPAVVEIRTGRGVYHAQEYPTELMQLHELIQRVNFCQSLASA